MSSPKRRQHLKKFLAVSTLGASGMLGVIQRVLAAGPTPVAPGMHSMKGEVLIDGKPAKVGQQVPPGATVSTRAGAQAIYVIGQDAFLQRENSTVSFGADAAKTFFRILSGKMLSVFGKGEKTLETPTATIGIRGTGCYIEASEKLVYFCLCYGVAEIIPSADKNHVERIETQHHDHPLVISDGQNRPMMADAKVINHTDTELTLLENLTGRWPPFYGNSNNYY